MAITRRPPGTIYLGGGDGPGGESGYTIVNEYTAGAAITPGMLIEKYDDAGTTKWRPHSAAADMQDWWVALEQSEMNLGVDDPYAIGDLVKAAKMQKGSFFWGIVASGQTIANLARLQSNGDGRTKAATATTAAANVAYLQALEALGGPLGAHTRCRLEVI